MAFLFLMEAQIGLTRHWSSLHQFQWPSVWCDSRETGAPSMFFVAAFVVKLFCCCCCCFGVLLISFVGVVVVVVLMKGLRLSSLYVYLRRIYSI